MSLDMMLKYMVNKIGIPLPDAVKMVTTNPARALGIDNSKGRLVTGRQADIVVLDKALSIKMVILSGQIITQL